MPHVLPTIPFLPEFVVLLGAAVAVLLVSHAIRVPPVVALLLTGLAIGPHGFHLIADEAMVELFAEVGVVLLLFSVGLEFSLERLREVGRAFFGGGTLQAGLTIGVVFAIAVSTGLPLERALFYGFLAALSSTAIVLKLYADRREMDAPQGKLVIGILLFQDFLIVPLVVITPVLAGAVDASGVEIALRLGGGALAVGAIFLVARTVMPRLLHAIVRTRISELLVLAPLLIGLGMALATEALGFSLALGAFLAGILIAESEYSHHVVAEMAPFRDLFTSLFFISIGMLLQLEVVSEHLGTVGTVVVLVVVVKALVVFGAVRSIGYPTRTATITALSLAQIGEFSFVLAQVGLASGVLPGLAYQVFLAAAIATMIATPFMIRWAPAVADRVRRLPLVGGGQVETVPEPTLEDHVVIVGFGVNGRNLARVLGSVRIPYVVVELNGETVRAARAAGEPVLFGDFTRVEVLEACAIEEAETLVVGISDPEAVRRGVRLAREMNPALHIVVRVRGVAEIERALAAGADEVVAEEFETSIEIFTRVLERFHVPSNVIEAQLKVLRGDAYRRLRGPRGAGRVSEAVLDVLAEGTTDVFYVREESPAAGRSLAGLDLRRRTGATVIAVVRDGLDHPNPDPDFRIESGDAMVLVGDHAAITRGFDLLEGRAE
ncbi:MAG: cation:proton antiporter [Gemmatimonadota bacterium]|nr:cation:proton antiporter [Gemmatimonadota bacterium]